MAGHNQVIYPNAFTDFKADVRYTYTKAGFEQDIILREQPPTPESFGLNPATARLEILTEFFSPPQPTIQSTAMPTQAGLSLTDQSLGFGTMQMIPGRAFMLGANATDAGVRVDKQWLLLNRRQFLVEEVPVEAIADKLAELPLPAVQSSSSTTTHTVSRHLILPPQRLAKTSTKPVLLAKAPVPTQGLVLDYQLVNGTFTNFTFQGDTTYYLGGVVVMGGTNTFEGGTVIKFDDWSRGNKLIISTLVPGNNSWIFKTGPYRPAIFTSMEDNSVGETIDGSDGSPFNTGATYLCFDGDNPSSNPIQYVRFSWAETAILQEEGTQCSPVLDCQFMNCSVAILDKMSWVVNEPVQKLYNVLMSNCGMGVQNMPNSPVIVDGENMTVDRMDTLLSAGDNITGNFANCILATVTCLTNGTANVSLSGDTNGFYKSPEFGTNPKTNTFYPFQTVGAGDYYLASGCAFTNAGTTNIDPMLLADLQQKTTYPPLLRTNTVSTNTTLNPQALRDTDTPDLGYHYDPIDYLVDTFTVTNALLTISSGTVIAADNTSAGILLSDGSAIASIGTPLLPNWFVYYKCVQEQPVAIGSSSSLCMIINSHHSGNLDPTGVFQFSKFAVPAGGSNICYHFYDTSLFAYKNLLIQNCELWNGANIFDGKNSITASIQNTLFARSGISATTPTVVTNYGLSFFNSLFWNMPVTLRSYSNSNIWFLFNNDFDGCAITTTTPSKKSTVQHLTVNGYNAYLNCTNRLSPTNAFDIVTNATLAYQTGPLGNFYQPTTSRLIDKGSTNANLLGLYHYTTQTNQMKETNSTVDIGYHYIALDGSGNPLDSNRDGIPDYVEDANGNGLVDPGETNWGLAILIQPQSQTVIQGSNATFNVTAGGITPLSYQWYFNGTNVSGATNTLLNLTNVTSGNSGNYYVVVTNSFGSITSQLAVLTVTNGPFIMGINFGGTNVTIEGNLWRSYTYALTNGLSVSNAVPGSIAITNLNPATDSDTSNMLQTFIRHYRLPPLAQQTNLQVQYSGNPTNCDAPTMFTNVPNGFMVTNGNPANPSWYSGWCVKHDYPYPPNNAFQTGEVFYTYGFLAPLSQQTNLISAVLQQTNLNKVNYVLNNKTTNTNTQPHDIQNAIWNFMGATLSYTTTLAYTNLVNAANSNGVNFIPASNQIATVIADFVGSWTTNTNAQPVLVEVSNLPVSLMLTQTNLSNGYDTVYLWLAENEASHLRSLNIKVQGITWGTGIGTNLALGQTNWIKLGPYMAVVTNQSLTVEVDSPVQGDPMLMGMAIYGGSVATNQPPVITQQPVNVTTNAGGNAMFSVTVSTNSTLPLSYQWWFNTNNILAGATNAVLMLTNVQTTNAGAYSVVVTNLAGSVTSSNGVLTVNSSAFNVQIISPANQTLLARSNVIISATATNSATGAPISWVEFFSNGTNSLGFAVASTNGFYQLNWIPPLGGTNILTALVMDSQGSNAWSAPVTNYVRKLPVVTITSLTNGQVFPFLPTNITITSPPWPTGQRSPMLCFIRERILSRPRTVLRTRFSGTSFPMEPTL